MTTKSWTAAYIAYAEGSVAVLAWGIYMLLIAMIADDEHTSVEQAQVAHGVDIAISSCLLASMIVLCLHLILMRHLGRRPIQPLGLKVIAYSFVLTVGYTGGMWVAVMWLSTTLSLGFDEGWTLTACVAVICLFTPWIIAYAEQRWQMRTTRDVFAQNKSRKELET